jgi:aryl-phospho-beta-D-glucosidase BglC (GH1 family)
MCEKYGLSILLDLHGAPGSQNGIDHSGCGMEASWLELKQNRDLTLQAIEVMAQRYGPRRALLGIEIANEPALKYCQDFLPEMTRLYESAYHIIRRHSASCLVVFNELYEVCYDAWKGKLQEPKFYNVLIDLHLYNWQLPYTMQSAVTHVANAVAWEDVIEQVSRSHPVIVGEWCFSTGTYVQAGQDFVSACVDSFRTAAGWYLWTWKVEPGIRFDEWDVQLQYRKSDGMHV